MIENKKAKVKVLNTKDNWFGLTYQEDKEVTACKHGNNVSLFTHKRNNGVKYVTKQPAR